MIDVLVNEWDYLLYRRCKEEVDLYIEYTELKEYN